MPYARHCLQHLQEMEAPLLSLVQCNFSVNWREGELRNLPPERVALIPCMHTQEGTGQIGCQGDQAYKSSKAQFRAIYLISPMMTFPGFGHQIPVRAASQHTETR